MLDDTDRLLGTVEQVLKAGEVGYKHAARHRVEVDFGELVRECMELARTRHHLAARRAALGSAASERHRPIKVQGDPGGTAHRRFQYARQRHQVFRRKRGCIRSSGNAGREARGPARARPRRGNSRGRTEAHLQALLSRAGPSRFAGERHGLGLFIVRAVARAHGGKVFAESGGEGSGTTVTFELPRSDGVSRVLVVEDEAHLAEGLRFNLEAEGHSVEVVGDGESALDRCSATAKEFDAVVLDVMLPGHGRLRRATALRKAKNYVPVLMLTARGRPEDVLKGFAAGADDYLPKPFELPIFLARLQGLLRRSEWLRGDASRTPAKDARPQRREATARLRAARD